MKDQNYDVIVVGSGNAAQTAAFAAYEAGAKVLVLEKAPESKRGAIRRELSKINVGTVLSHPIE
jgi:tricarballylate dehydrogenase